MAKNDDPLSTRLLWGAAASQLHEQAANSNACVLITGETGVGKSVLARLLHQMNHRRTGRFVTVDTTNLPKELVESELFGLVEGFYHGSPKGKKGLVQVAAGGTLFFDEIGDMEYELQAKLLRFVQDHECRRVGATQDEKIDVRCIFATNCNLEQKIEEGRFRRDLFFRICAIRIELLPLREQPEEIVRLASHFCRLKARELGRQAPQLTDELQQWLQRHRWPGNIRELETYIGTLVEFCGATDKIGPEHLSGDLRKKLISQPASAPQSPRTGPPPQSDPTYQRVVRIELSHRVRTVLQRQRAAVLLQTHYGGGRTLVRQLAPQLDPRPIWLWDQGGEHTQPDLFFSKLTGDNSVLDQRSFDAWLRARVQRDGSTLVVHTQPRGPEALLESVAASVRSLLDANNKVQFLIIGGERLLRLRKPDRYSWIRLLPEESFIDVPDLTVLDVTELLRGRSLPEDRAKLLHEHTGGHPWLLYRLISQRIIDPEAALASVKGQLVASRKLERHLDDAKAGVIIRKLLTNESVASLGKASVRHSPGRYAESRLYLDGLLTADAQGQTQFRCPAVRILFDEELSQ